MKYGITLSVLALITSLFAGCFSIGITPKTPPQASPITPSVSPAPLAPGWVPSQAPVSNAALPDMVAVVDRVKPSVVVIDVIARGYDIFNFPVTQEGAGSGWIVDSDGLIVTNNHVVSGAQEINVTLSDGRSFEAQEVSTDPLSDLAVIKIDATGLPAARVGDSSDLKVGTLVAAIGNALGRGISMTGGWISRLDVSIDASGGQTLYDLIETDAAINPGNSGGPLVNMAGEVIGITSAKLVDVDVEGIGYAIASNTAMPIISELITKGYVVRPWFGISLRTVNQGIASRYGLSVDRSALIVQIADNSPATDAGLKLGDVIVSAGDQEITNADEMVQAIYASKISQQVRITYWRENKQQTTGLIPVEKPRP
ncbi:MAG: trypsin-like peptidase domain-containing protein [Chloroflexota bacterium]